MGFFMILKYTSAIILTTPLLTMIKPSLKYWQDYKAEKKNKGNKASYSFSFYLFIVGVLGMWMSWLYGIVLMAMGKDLDLFHWTPILIEPSASIQIIGLIIFAIGAFIYNSTLIIAGKYLRPAPSGTLCDHVLIKKGPFSIIRHPLYISYFLIAVGLSLILFNYLPMVSTLFIAIGIYPAAKAEEKVLVKQLGEEYINYQKRVAMFVPDLRKLMA